MSKWETYRAEGNGGSGQADQTAIPGMRLVDSIGIFNAELLDDILNLEPLLCNTQLSDDPLKTMPSS